MTLLHYAVIGGIWLSLLYSSMVVPATVWTIQLTVSRGWLNGAAAATGLALGQLPWCLLAALLLFQMPGIWQEADLVLRAGTIVFCLWLGYRNARSGRVRSLNLVIEGSTFGVLTTSAVRSLVMPWRFPLWAGLIICMGIHLRGPGWLAGLLFTAGAFAGQIAWLFSFVCIAGLFGKRVPEDISLHSMNKLRLLATIAPVGLALVCLAPVIFL